MKQRLMWLAAGMIALSMTACEKEQGTAKGNVQDAGAIMNAKSINMTYPNCTLAHGNSCTPGGFSCMLRFPPDMFATGVPTRFYAPQVTNAGETGIQMAVEFLGTAAGVEAGLLGPDEWSEPTIVLHEALANGLGYTHIEVINKRYYPVINAKYRFGAVIYDCKVK